MKSRNEVQHHLGRRDGDALISQKWYRWVWRVDIVEQASKPINDQYQFAARIQRLSLCRFHWQRILLHFLHLESPSFSFSSCPPPTLARDQCQWIRQRTKAKQITETLQVLTSFAFGFGTTAWVTGATKARGGGWACSASGSAFGSS